MAQIHSVLCDVLAAATPVVLATIVEGPGVGSKLLVYVDPEDGTDLGDLGDPELTRTVACDARSAFSESRTSMRRYGSQGQLDREEITVFFELFEPPPRMIIFGAVDFTGALVRVAKIAGYRVLVCDAREAFATRLRFPGADEVENLWPQELLEQIGKQLGPGDAICILTHDPKFDVPAITSALQTRVGYIGCMGSRSTHARRLARLREAGVSEDEMSRVMAPIGLDIGARSPAETAISICSEIISLRNGRGARSLRDSQGPIRGHRSGFS